MALIDTLSAFWDFEEAGGATRVDSHGSYDLSDVGGVSQDIGIHGNGAQFDGVDDALLSPTTPLTLNPAEQFSFAIWFKPDSPSTNGYIFSLNSPSSGASVFVRQPSPSTVQFRFHNGSSTQTSATIAITNGAWNLLEFFKESDGTMTLHVNQGVSASIASSPTRTGSPIANLISFCRHGAVVANLGKGTVDSGMLAANHIWDASERAEIWNIGAGIQYSDIAPSGGASVFKEIPVTPAQVTGSHTNMPVLVQPSLIAGFGAISLAEAQSIRVYANEAKTTELPREIVSADEIYILVPTLDDTTSVFIDYDGTRTDHGYATSFGRNAVWSNYDMVVHMNESPVGASSVVDSTGKHTGLTPVGSMTAGDLVDVGSRKGIDFDGNNDMLQHTSSTLLDGYNNYTIQIECTPAQAAARKGIAGKTDGNTLATSSWILEQRSTTSELYFRNSYSSSANLFTGLTLVSDTTHFITCLKDATLLKSYMDGVIGNQMTVSDFTINSFAGDLGIGGYGVLSALEFIGNISEFRFREGALSENYVLTEERNQSDNGAFWGTAIDLEGGEPDPVINNNVLFARRAI